MKSIQQLVKVFFSSVKNFVLSFAYLFVALLTSIAGYSLASDNLSLNSLVTRHIALIVVYSLLLWPYYASRQGLVERRLDDPEHPIDIDSIRYGIEYPAYVITVVAVIAFFTFNTFYVPPTSFYFGEWQDVVLSLFLALLPFLVLFIGTLRDLVSNKKDKAFGFSERVLFPSLCTGIVPFAFGWSIANDPINLALLFVVSIFVVVLIIISRIQQKGELKRLSFMLALALLGYILTFREDIKTIVLGAVITLAMAVSEASKKVRQASVGDRFFPEDEGLKYYLAGSNWASIVFLWFLCLVPLVIDDLPTLPFLIFITAQSLLWFYKDESFKESIMASFLSLLFGYGLPIGIILVKFADIDSTFLPGSVKPVEAIIPFTILLALSIWFFGQDFKIILFSQNIFQVDSYLTRKNTYFLFFIVLTFLMILTLTIAVFSDNPLIKTKASEIILFSTIIALVLIITYLKTRTHESNEKDYKGNQMNEKNNKPHLLQELNLVLISARPLSALIAGLALFFILVTDNNDPAWIDVLQSIPIILVTMVGFILNDIFDYEKDARGNVQRPIALGLLDRNRARYYAIFLALCAIAIEGVVNRFVSFDILAITLLGVLLYSPLSKRIPVLKGAATTALTLTPIFYASSVIDKTIPLYIYLSIAIFVMGREILLDTKDLDRDSRSGIKTIVAYLGLHPSRLIAWSSMFGGTIYLLFNLDNLFAVIPVIIGLLSLIVALVLDFHNRVRDGGLTKLTMIFCVLSLLFIW